MKNGFKLVLLLAIIPCLVFIACQKNDTSSPVSSGNDGGDKQTGKAATVQMFLTPLGETVFTSSGCTDCHSVSSMGIESKKKKPVDLTNLGTLTGIDSDFLRLYLKKDAKYNKKTHPDAFKGTDADYEELIAWLLTL